VGCSRRSHRGSPYACTKILPATSRRVRTGRVRRAPATVRRTGRRLRRRPPSGAAGRATTGSAAARAARRRRTRWCSSARPTARQRPRVLFGKVAVGRGDGAAVGAGLRVAQVRRKAFFDLVREDVLELAGFVVHLVPGKIEVVSEEALAQAVATHEAQGLAAALFGEQHVACLVAFDQAFGGQARDHLRDEGAARPSSSATRPTVAPSGCWVSLKIASRYSSRLSLRTAISAPFAPRLG